jgi:hypothetical protein
LPDIPGTGVAQHDRALERSAYRIALAQFRADDLEQLCRELKGLTDADRIRVLSVLRIPLVFASNGPRCGSLMAAALAFRRDNAGDPRQPGLRCSEIPPDDRRSRRPVALVACFEPGLSGHARETGREGT